MNSYGVSAPIEGASVAVHTYVRVGSVIALGLLLAAPALLPPYELSLLTLGGIYAGLTVSWHLVAGYTGQLSLGHSVFVAIGALLPVAIHRAGGLDLAVGAFLAMCLSAVLGASLTAATNRFQVGEFAFAIVTLAFAEVGLLVFTVTPFLGGAAGLVASPDSSPLVKVARESPAVMHLMVISGLVAVLATTALVMRSRFGLYFRAVRDNRRAAESAGVATDRMKIVAMAISAAMTSFVGTLFGQYLGFIDPFSIGTPSIMFSLLLYAAVGGIGTLIGPAAGAFLLVPVSEYLRSEFGGSLPGLHLLVFGVLIIATVFVFKTGVSGAYLATLEVVANRRHSAALRRDDL